MNYAYEKENLHDVEQRWLLGASEAFEAQRLRNTSNFQKAGKLVYQSGRF